MWALIDVQEIGFEPAGAQQFFDLGGGVVEGEFGAEDLLRLLLLPIIRMIRLG